MTNVGNQVLIYAYMRKRCDGVVRRCFPSATEEQLNSYFSFAQTLRMSMLNYISLGQLADIWLHPPPENELNYRILRTVCRYFIREHQTTAILTSKKMLKEAKPLHLKARRELMSLFRRDDLWWINYHPFFKFLADLKVFERENPFGSSSCHFIERGADGRPTDINTDSQWPSPLD